MLRGSWTHAPARMAIGLAVAFALARAVGLGAALAADTPAPSAPLPAVPPPATVPPAVVPPAAPPSAAPPPATAPPAVPRSGAELDGPAPLPQASSGGSTQSGIAGCAVWTDRCIICQRDGGVVACSNIGVACQPQALLCLRPETPPEKKPPN